MGGSLFNYLNGKKGRAENTGKTSDDGFLLPHCTTLAKYCYLFTISSGLATYMG